MIRRISSPNDGITYLIAANVGVLTLCVMACWFDIDQDSDRPTSSELICSGVGVGQAMMLGAYLALAKLPFLVRLRWFSRLITVQWFFFTVPFIPLDSYSGPHFPWPWCVMIDQLLVSIAAFLSVGIYRWISGRVVTIESDYTVRQPTQFRIFDLLILISLVALMLAITMRYKNELKGWDGLAYAILVLVGLYFGSPIGAIVPLFLIGMLSKAKKTVVVAISALAFVLCVGLGTLIVFHMNEKMKTELLPISVTLLFSLSILALVLANTFAIRGLCYRLCKLPRTGRSESIEDNSNKNDGEPSHA